jgi:hypothetical protein
MPRDATIETNYFPMTAAGAVTAANAALAGFSGFTYDVEQAWEPLLFRVYIPKITVATLNATVTFSFVEETGAPQTLQEAIVEGITAAGNTGPVIVERRIVPEKDLTITPTLVGPRKVSVFAQASAGTATIPANTATTVAFLQILNLARQ